MTRTDDLDRVLPLSPTAFHVLVAMANGPRHGYAIAQDVEAVIPELVSEDNEGLKYANSQLQYIVVH